MVTCLAREIPAGGYTSSYFEAHDKIGMYASFFFLTILRSFCRFPKAAPKISLFSQSSEKSFGVGSRAGQVNPVGSGPTAIAGLGLTGGIGSLGFGIGIVVWQR